MRGRRHAYEAVAGERGRDGAARLPVDARRVPASFRRPRRWRYGGRDRRAALRFRQSPAGERRLRGHDGAAAPSVGSGLPPGHPHPLARAGCPPVQGQHVGGAGDGGRPGVAVHGACRAPRLGHDRRDPVVGARGPGGRRQAEGVGGAAARVDHRGPAAGNEKQLDARLGGDDVGRGVTVHSVCRIDEFLELVLRPAEAVCSPAVESAAPLRAALAAGVPE